MAWTRARGGAASLPKQIRAHADEGVAVDELLGRVPDQCPVYFISEVFSDSKQCYPHYEKLAFGVFFAARKLRHYFHDHTIMVVSKAPLKDIINNADATGRVTK